MTGNWVAPDACTLPTADQPLRVAEFDRLFTRHLLVVERHGPTRATMLLSGSDGLVESVRNLAHRETQCCSFFAFTVSRLPMEDSLEERVLLEVEVPPARADVLSALADRAESARKSGHHLA